MKTIYPLIKKGKRLPKFIYRKRIIIVFNIICAFLLLIALLHLPIQYYRFLRIIVFVGCLLIIINKEVPFFWKLIFLPIAILFNPILPVYLYLKPYWMPLDVVAAILFLLIAFYGYKTKTKEIVKESKNETRNMYKIKN